MFIKCVKNYKFTICCIVSPNDPHFAEILQIIPKNWLKISYKNNPVGEKLNASIDLLLQNIKFDYLMNFGSDDIIHPDLMTIYTPYINRKIQMIGLSNIYFYNYKTKDCVFLELFNKHIPYGLGRLIHISVLQKLKQKNQNLYPDRADSGLDSQSHRNMMALSNFDFEIITPGKLPLTVDIKTDTNINHWSVLINMIEKPVKFQKIENISTYFHKIIEQ
jgi:hypothetical protein